MNVDKLIKMLSEVTYTYTSIHNNYRDTLPVISKEHMPLIVAVVREYVAEEHDHKLGVLEAKCFAYEQIIANSNFAPMLQMDGTSEEGGEE